MINYCINPDTQYDYAKIKNNFLKIKELVLNNSEPDLIILITNNRYTYKGGLCKFLELREQYYDKIIKIFLVRENDIIDVIGPIKLENSDMFFDIATWMVNFIPSDQYFDFYANIKKYFIGYDYPKEKLVFFE